MSYEVYATPSIYISPCGVIPRSDMIEQLDEMVCSVVLELSVSVFIVSIPFIWISVFTDLPSKLLKCTRYVMKGNEERDSRIWIKRNRIRGQG